MEINQFKKDDTNEVIKLALYCQNDGTRTLISVETQQDLLNIFEDYIASGGNFWVAKDDDKLAGTIGLVKYNDKIGILKKFFVYEKYRGKPHHLGQKLYFKLMGFAKEININTIILDTPKNTTRAHKFYEKAGFKKIEPSELPISYKTPYKMDECDFFIMSI